jgi:hypothetical protein
VWPKCGIGIYNPATQFCSGNTLYSKCGGEIYNPLSQECTDGVVTGYPYRQIICSNVNNCVAGGIDVQNDECIDVKINWTDNWAGNVIMRCGNASYNNTSIKVGSKEFKSQSGQSEATIISGLQAGLNEVLVCVSFNGTQTTINCRLSH